MFCKAALIPVALALIAAASPVAPGEGVVIPLAKRSSLTNADGTFNHGKAILHNVKTHKYVCFSCVYRQRTSLADFFYVNFVASTSERSATCKLILAVCPRISRSSL